MTGTGVGFAGFSWPLTVRWVPAGGGCSLFQDGTSAAGGRLLGNGRVAHWPFIRRVRVIFQSICSLWVWLVSLCVALLFSLLCIPLGFTPSSPYTEVLSLLYWVLSCTLCSYSPWWGSCCGGLLPAPLFTFLYSACGLLCLWVTLPYTVRYHVGCIVRGCRVMGAVTLLYLWGHRLAGG